MGGVETSEPEGIRKKPEDLLSENGSIRSRKPADQRGVKLKSDDQ